MTFVRCSAMTAKGTQCTREVSRTGATTCRQHATTPERNPMTDLDHTFISHRRLLVQAGDLLSDHGDDPVHDEAIVELVARLLGRDGDNAAVSTLIIQTYSRS